MDRRTSAPPVCPTCGSTSPPVVEQIRALLVDDRAVMADLVASGNGVGLGEARRQISVSDRARKQVLAVLTDEPETRSAFLALVDLYLRDEVSLDDSVLDAANLYWAHVEHRPAEDTPVG
ncbi:hypothetical protein [Kutzneria sp. 744]|uniref:hypothetical protein n=1 Tax=Kutzneria sp. (strain 744) TaxID=345341 RepID=UPI0004B14BDC|nr:hypothetical protein [Kutzneria sp. 744]